MDNSPEINRLLKSAGHALATGQLRQAHEDCIAVLKLNTQHPEAHFLLAVNALERRELKKALTLISRAIESDPGQLRYYLQLARCQVLLHANEEAIQTLSKALELPNAHAHDYDTIGVLYSKLGDHGQAIYYFKKAVEQQPKTISYLYNLATSQRINGELSEALKSLEQILKLQPNFYHAYSLIPELRKASADNNLIDSIKPLLSHPNVDPIAHLHLCHGLAREYEHLGDFKSATHWLSQGNSKRKKELNYSIENDLNLFNHLTTNCNQEWIKTKAPGHLIGDNQPKPIFIIGMPRSGTTLLERIITSHSEVTALGELLDFPLTLKRLTNTRSNLVLDNETITKGLALDFQQVGQQYCQRLNIYNPKSEYIVDKLPLNFFYAAYINKALPDARIICLRRNPMDICLSNLKQLFAINFSYYNYSLDVTDCANYLVAYDKLINHWRNVLPANRFLEIQYEDLIENTELRAKAVLDFIGLEWQEQCLAFDKNRTPVATASAVQVRQPIYKSSMGSWTKYEHMLEPAKAIFTEAGIFK